MNIIRVNTWVTLIAALGLTYGCSGAAPTTVPTALATAAAPTSQNTVAPSPSPATTQAEVKILPRVFGPPEPLDTGTYQTDPSFSPQVSFTVPAGWYGGQGDTGFGIGQGYDAILEGFRDGGIYLDVLAMPRDQAVAAFQKVEGLDAGQPQTIELGGYPALTFHPKAHQQVLLGDALGAMIDIGPHTDQAIFIEVEGTTAIIRTEVFYEEGRRGVAQALESFQFSP